MDLYYSPLACSMSSRIALYEAAAQARFVEVDPETKRTTDGEDYHTINPIGLVPALRTDAGDILTENAAVLQYIAAQLPAAQLAPTEGFARARLQQWLCFIGTELHKGAFIPLFDQQLPESYRAKVLDNVAERFAYLDRYLGTRDFLLDQFSVADAYLFTVLNWTKFVGIDLAPWPALLAYYKRLRKRPSVARALEEENGLYLEEQKRHQAA